MNNAWTQRQRHDRSARQTDLVVDKCRLEASFLSILKTAATYETADVHNFVVAVLKLFIHLHTVRIFKKWIFVFIIFFLMYIIYTQKISYRSGEYFRSYTQIWKDVSECLEVRCRSGSDYLNSVFKFGGQHYAKTAKPISLKL